MLKKKAIFGSPLLAGFILLNGFAGCGSNSDGDLELTPEDLLRLLGHLPLLSGPKGLALESGSHTVLVTEFDSGELSRIDLTSGLVKTVATGLKSPFAVVIEADGLTALVTEACPEAHRILRVNLERGDVTPFIVSEDKCFAGLTLESSSTVLVTEPNNALISRIHLDTGARERVIDSVELTGADGLALISGNSLLVLSHPPQFVSGSTINMFKVSRINLSTPVVESLISDSGITRSYGIFMESRGNSALVTAESANSGLLMRVSGLHSGPVTLEPLTKALNGPAGLAILPEGAVLILENGSNDIAQISLSQCLTGPCLAPPPLIPGLGYPIHIAIEPNGRTALVSEQNPLVPEQDVGEISRIDVMNGKVTTLFTRLNHPEGFAINDGVLYLVEKNNPGSVKEIDFNTKRVRLITTGLNYPSGIVLEDATTALVTERGADRLLKVNLTDGTVVPLSISSSLQAPSEIALEANKKTVIVAEIASGEDDAGRLSRIDLETGKVHRITSGLDYPSGIAITPEGDFALVVEQSTGVLSKVRITGPLTGTPASIIPIITDLHHPQRVAVEKGGATALITENNPDGIRRVKIK